MLNFVVTIRHEDGSIKDIPYVAESRTELFNKLANDRVVVIKVRVKNINETMPQYKSLTKKILLLLSIFFCVLFIILFFNYFKSSDSHTKQKQPSITKSKTKERTIKPSDNSHKKKDTVRVSINPEIQDSARYWERETTNGMSEAQIRKWKFKRLPPPAYTNDAMQLREKPRFEIFPTRAENEIAMLMSIVPGEGLVGSPQYDDFFRKEFLKSCETPIVIDKNDSEYVKQLKHDMIEVKKELMNRISNGEDICQIMTTTREEAMRLGLISQQINDETRLMLNEVKTEEDLNLVIDEANKLLEKEGIAPIELTPMIKYNILRKAKNN